MTKPLTNESTPAPVRDRLHNIDAIRGFAILGILLANIRVWSGHKVLPFEFIASELTWSGADPFLYWVFKFFVENKFYAIFSMLFGAGFAIQYAKYRDDESTFIPTYRRRLTWLLVFGLIHTFFWSSDILALYAIYGFILVAMRRLSGRQVLGWSIFFFIVCVVPNGVMMLVSPGEPVAPADWPRAGYAYPDMHWKEVVQVAGSGSFWEIAKLNLHHLYWREFGLIPNGRVWRIMAFFLLGFWLLNNRFFTVHALRGRNFVLFFVTGFALMYVTNWIGGPMSAWPANAGKLLARLTDSFAQVLWGLAYMCLIAWLYKHAWGALLLKPLTLIGRTAFTSYLAQTAIGVVIFYGYGFGLCGTMSLAQLWLLALGIYAGQVAFASTWLRYFRFGPLEWIWRCLTYRRWFPLRR